jgi:hypothetical protein
MEPNILTRLISAFLLKLVWADGGYVGKLVEWVATGPAAHPFDRETAAEEPDFGSCSGADRERTRLAQPLASIE